MNILVAETQEQLNRCLEVRCAVFTVERKVPREIDVDELDCLDGACDHFLMVEEGTDIGTLRCKRMDDEAVQLQRFCVMKEYRGKGYARKAMEFVEAYYRRERKMRITLDSKFEACGFYEKCGYVKVSEPFEEAGIPHIKMEKNLF